MRLLVRSASLLLLAALMMAVALPAFPAIEAKPAYDFASSKIKHIYVIPSSHWDKGWFHPADVEEAFFKQHLDQVIEAGEKHPDFRWMVETNWPVGEWLKRTPDARQRKRLFALVRQGRIGLPGNFIGDGGLFGSEEVNRLGYQARHLRDTYGVPINTAMMDDVPGYSWALPQVLAKSGVRYLVTGLNLSFGGGTSIPKKDIPFYWQGPDGSKVLTWVSDSYSDAVGFYGLGPEQLRFFYGRERPELLSMTDMQIMESETGSMLKKFDGAGYPYDAVLAIHSGDYAEPYWAARMLIFIKAWNAAHASPRIQLALPEEFFRHIEAKYAGKIPTYAGDWSGAWLSGTAAVMTPMIRWTRDHLTALEKLASINHLLNPNPYLVMGGTGYSRLYPEEDIGSAYERLLGAEGHGGGIGTGWPKLMTRREVEHNNYVHFDRIRDVHERTAFLLSSELEALGHQIQTDGRAIVVFNPLSWERTDVVCAPVNRDLRASEFKLEEAANSKPVPYQKTEDGGIEFLAEGVPSVGYRLYRIVPPRPSTSDLPVPPPAVMVVENSIENAHYRVALDEEGNIASIFDKAQKRELVNARSKFQFNRLIRAASIDVFSGTGKFDRVPTGAITIAGGSGAVSGRLVVTREDSPDVRTEIVLYDKLKRIDLVHVLDRTRLDPVPPARFTDTYLLPFPFNLSREGLEVRVESTSTFLNPTTDFLPGAYVGKFVSQHEVRMDDGAGGVTLANRQASVTEFGEIGGRKLKFSPSEATLISRLFMKIDQGDTRDLGVVTFPDLEPGAGRHYRFEFSLTSDGARFDPVAAAHFGWEFNVPLLAWEFPKQAGPLKQPSQSFFELDKPNVLLLDVKRASFGDRSDYILRLQEIAGRPQTKVAIRSAFPVKRAELDDPVEERVRDLPVSPLEVPVGGHETVTVRLSY